MNPHRLIYRFGPIVIILLVNLTFAQGFSDNTSSGGLTPSTGFTQSLLNPNRLDMSQSVSFVASSGNGYSSSVGFYSNFLKYQINDQLWVNADLHFIQPLYSSGLYSQPEFDVNYDVALNYKPTENTFFQFRFARYSNPYLTPNLWYYGR